MEDQKSGREESGDTGKRGFTGLTRKFVRLV